MDRLPATPLVVTLYWTASGSDNVAQYGIYRRMLGEVTFSRIATVPGTQTSYTDLLTRNLDAEYQVVSIDSSGSEGEAAGPIYSEAPLPGPPS